MSNKAKVQAEGCDLYLGKVHSKTKILQVMAILKLVGKG